MTDSLMPHGLSCLYKLLNTERPSPATSWKSTLPCLANNYSSRPERRLHNETITILPQLIENNAYAVRGEDGEENVPSVVFTPKADMVRRDLTGALEGAGIWQEIAPNWDRVQIRFNRCRPYEVERRNAKQQCTIKRPTEINDKPLIEYDEIIDPLTNKKVQFPKKVPGYCGYVPRYPVMPKPAERCKNPGFKSISKATYREFPSNEYIKQELAHKGPLSSQVTTTAPFNPYNKLDLICLNGKRLLWKRPILEQAKLHMKQR